MRRERITHTYKNMAMYNREMSLMTNSGWRVEHLQPAGKKVIVTWYRDVPNIPGQAPVTPQKKGGLPAIAIVGIVIGALFLFGIIAAAIGGGSKATATATPGNVAAQSVATGNTQSSLSGQPTVGKPTATEKPAATPIPSVGQAVSLKNWDVTVVTVEKPGPMLQTSSGGNKKTAIGQWIVLAVDLKNTGKENFGLNDFDFVLKDANGASIKVKNDLGFESGYNSYRGGLAYNTQIPPGSTVHAFIAFDVGPDANGMKLEFQGNKQLIGLGF